MVKLMNKLLFSKLNKPECIETYDYYFVFKDGISNAAEEFILEFNRLKEIEKEYLKLIGSE